MKQCWAQNRVNWFYDVVSFFFSMRRPWQFFAIAVWQFTFQILSMFLLLYIYLIMHSIFFILESSRGHNFPWSSPRPLIFVFFSFPIGMLASFTANSLAFDTSWYLDTPISCCTFTFVGVHGTSQVFCEEGLTGCCELFCHAPRLIGNAYVDVDSAEF